MNTFTVPVPMLVNKGGALAVGVIALLIMLALASKSDPTVRNQRI